MKPPDRECEHGRVTENLQQNLKLVESVAAIAKAKNCTAGQLSLAWLLQKGRPGMVLLWVS